jgi:hypothetical protein
LTLIGWCAKPGKCLIPYKRRDEYEEEEKAKENYEA